MYHDEKLPNFRFFQYVVRAFSCSAIFVEERPNIIIFFQVAIIQQHWVVTNNNILKGKRPNNTKFDIVENCGRIRVEPEIYSSRLTVSFYRIFVNVDYSSLHRTDQLQSENYSR